MTTDGIVRDAHTQMCQEICLALSVAVLDLPRQRVVGQQVEVGEVECISIGGSSQRDVGGDSESVGSNSESGGCINSSTVSNQGQIQTLVFLATCCLLKNTSLRRRKVFFSVSKTENMW